MSRVLVVKEEKWPIANGGNGRKEMTLRLGNVLEK
jgi:hypothetical protein